MTWEEATRRCQEMGGHLATITSQDEMDQLIAMAEAEEVRFVWLGGYTSSSAHSTFPPCQFSNSQIYPMASRILGTTARGSLRWSFQDQPPRLGMSQSMIYHSSTPSEESTRE